uniref:Ig-like domain-containing protein n=1 Tax=Microbulbifer agarilyticus TaxID=260552 RepID=UPI000255BA8D|nr:Ig-like domain-containing protein [Microbulbifer agarilyticus]
MNICNLFKYVFVLLMLFLSAKALSVGTFTQIVSPSNGSKFDAGSTIEVLVEAEDPDGIDVARLWVDGNYYDLDDQAPYKFYLSSLTEGEHTLMVRAKDGKGNAIDSQTITVSIEAPKPYARIISPKDGSVFSAGDTLTVAVDVFDPIDIEVARLWLNGQYWDIDQSAPFAFNISDLSSGTYSLEVRTKNQLGELLNSEVVSVDIVDPEISAPPEDVAIPIPESISIACAEETLCACRLDGGAVKIVFDLGEANASPKFFVGRGAAPDIGLFKANQDATDSESGTYWFEDLENDYSGDSVHFNVFSTSWFPGAGGLDFLYLEYDSLAACNSGNAPAPESEPESDPEPEPIASPEDIPYAKVTFPLNGATVNLGDQLIVRADAFAQGGISVARLWIDDVYHSLDNTQPYEFAVDGLGAGVHSLSIRAKDNSGNIHESDVVTITVSPDEISEEAILLPIEVFGPGGTTKSVRFDLEDPSSITHLYLRCNACGYHDIRLDKESDKVKASVRLNGGAAIPLKHFIENDRVYGNPDIRIIGGEADYGGIGGGFRTVRMTVPISGLVAGENILTFEHENAEAPSIGFRIIELNLLENGSLSNMILDASNIAYEDPGSWAPPRDTPQEIAEGKALWEARNTLYDPWLDNIDGQGNGRGEFDGAMQASCADCHAADGRDLKYFNFSNYSIIERSKFHGLSHADGEKIASYIRNLYVPLVSQARPWNPTYQPGAGLDSRPVHEWAAGAGIDAILDQDQDLAPYLFPNGTSLDAVRKVVDRFGKLNLRELPINIPMPEWNQWLPIIHPDDAFDTLDPAINSDARGRYVAIPFYKLLYNDAYTSPNRETLGYARDIKDWLRQGNSCGQGEPMRAINGDIVEAIALPMPTVDWNSCGNISASREALEMIEIAKRGLTAWSSVKMWEIIHSNNLEQESMQQGRSVCSDGRCVDASEPRGWVVDGRNVFDRPPHFTATGGVRQYFTQNQMLGIFESNAWYHLNMVLNTGYRETMPSHFAYTYSHVELLQQFSKIDQGFRFWATMIKQRQLQTNGKYGIEAGLDLRTAQPYIYYGTARGTTKTDTQSSIGQPLWGRLAQAMVEDFVDDANNATAQDWANATQNRKVQDRNSANFSPCSEKCTFDLGEYQGRNTYRVIPKLREIGVQDYAIQDLIDWAEKTWPHGPWDDLR